MFNFFFFDGFQEKKALPERLSPLKAGEGATGGGKPTLIHTPKGSWVRGKARQVQRAHHSAHASLRKGVQ